MRNIYLFLILICMSTFCWAKKDESSQSTIYTENKLGIMVTPDQPQFVIKIKSNPTTGYSWYLREYNTNWVTPVRQTFEAGDTKLVGAPGYEIWTFRVKQGGFVVPQQSVIRFVYARPWEDSDQSKQLVFRVSTLKAEKKTTS